MTTVAVTLHDVAREAGVSLATASRVLNGSTRRVAESYRGRVQEAAVEPDWDQDAAIASTSEVLRDSTPARR